MPVRQIEIIDRSNVRKNLSTPMSNLKQRLRRRMGRLGKYSGESVAHPHDALRPEGTNAEAGDAAEYDVKALKSKKPQ